MTFDIANEALSWMKVSLLQTALETLPQTYRREAMTNLTACDDGPFLSEEEGLILDRLLKLSEYEE